MIRSVDGSSVLPDTQFVGTIQRVFTTRVSSVGGSLHTMGSSCDMSELDIKPSLGAPLLNFPQSYRLSLFHNGIFPQYSEVLKSVFPRLGELTKAIEPARLPVIPLETRSIKVVLVYDHVNKPNRSYRTSGWLPMGRPRTCHRLIFLQLSVPAA